MADRGREASLEVSETNSGSQEASAGSQDRHFCYQCNKEVAVQGPLDGLTCCDCQGGFVEAVATLNPEFRRSSSRRNSSRRRRPPLPAAGGSDGNQTLSLSEDLEHLYPDEMMYMVQVLLNAARNGSRNRQSPPPEVHAGAGAGQDGSLAEDEHTLFQLGGDQAQAESERLAGLADHEHEHSEGAESDSDTGGLRLELEGFDLNDNEEETEWEEADEEEWDNQSDVHPAGEEPADRGERVRRARTNLRLYMRELFHNLADQNVEVRVELPSDMYLGNPGDYLDSREFDQLLLQLAENDSSRRGAPPAAKSAIEQLELVKIQQHHIDTGIAVCAICKELLALDEPAKQLPCLHLYHQDCILPWLSSRNSCPVCRYELPTDDPDYEEQKRHRRIDSSTRAVETPATEEEESSDRGQNSGSGWEEACRDVMETTASRAAAAPGAATGAVSSGGFTARSWLILAVGPFLSVMGFMFLSNLGNQLERLQMNPFFHKLQTFQLGESNNRYWWSFL